ncbi:hypothetical protein D187_003473 [Cystobacter fuscus DSM 2262]|uniref:Uncharacterized protein n=1 Tax=Cystobacter fuscus (strain ATCC 25194 / DSM 2262 / NBRC 100088 / M29) TaxID=1242864 RepID=S9P7I6_CYSF2|nr:hypothetical protein D187_003473 [Cystobacter fuscus DSM 2262]
MLTNSQSFTKTFIVRLSTRLWVVARAPLARGSAFFECPSSKKHCTWGIANWQLVPTAT